jgi:hypothetical protein
MNHWKTLWFTGEVVTLCGCNDQPLQVYTDGRRKYAACELCRRKWTYCESGWNREQFETF